MELTPHGEVFLVVVLAIQVATFFALGSWFLSQGQWRLGLAQILLVGVQALIYSGKMV